MFNSPKIAVARITFTFTPKYMSNISWWLYRDRKLLYIKCPKSAGRREVSDQAATSKEAEPLPAGTIEVTLRHQGVENRIIGSPEGVVRELLAYFTKLYPSLELVSKLILTQDDAEFLQSCTNILASSKEGLAVLKDVHSLRDKELILLYLAGSRLEHLVAAKDSDTVSLDELTRRTGRATGTVAGRLSELCNEQLAERAGKGSYRLTTMGTRTVVKTLMPKMTGFPER